MKFKFWQMCWVIPGQPPLLVCPHNHAHRSVVSPSVQRVEGTMLNLAAQRWGHKGRAFPDSQEAMAWPGPFTDIRMHA